MKDRFHRFRFVRFQAGTTLRWNVNYTVAGANVYFFSTYIVAQEETLDVSAIRLANVFRIAESVAPEQYKQLYRVSDERLFGCLEQFLTTAPRRVDLGNGASVVDLNAIVRIVEPSGFPEVIIDLI